MNHKNLTLRIYSAIIYVIVIALGTLVNSYGFAIVMALFLGFCLYEITKTVGLTNKNFIKVVFLIGYTVFFVLLRNFFDSSIHHTLTLSNILPCMGFLAAVYVIFFLPDLLRNHVAKIIFCAFYIGVPFSLALNLPGLVVEKSISKEVFFVFCLIWSSDTAAFFAGTYLGKHKLAPKISENKTVEGFVAGIIVTLFIGFIIEQYIPLNLKGNWIIIGLICSVCAPIGDLVESKIKRTFDIKDSSQLIPGHGGFLDRLDSFIFCVPFVFVYYLIYNSLY